MLGRKKDTPTVTTVESLEQEAHGSHAARPGAKNRPTPKRRDQEAARRRPVVDTDRKAAGRRDQADSSARHQAMMRGEEWALMPRDQGAFRRFARDSVDARRNLGELVMPMMFVALILSAIMSMTKVTWLPTVVLLLTYGTFLAAVVDAMLASRRIVARFRAAHPREQVPGGAGLYTGLRMFQMRRLRTPRPQVARGEHPR